MLDLLATAPDDGLPARAFVEAGGTWVFAYGSNMHLPDLARWIASRDLPPPRVQCLRLATLREHAIVWNYRSPGRRGGAANVAPAPGQAVPGVALLVDAATLHAIDRKEGHPARYSRGTTPKALELLTGGSMHAWVYEVTDAWRQPRQVPPRPEYLNLVIEGARRFGLPEWHLRILEATTTTRAT